MAEELEDLGTGIRVTDDFGIGEVDFADSILTSAKADDLVTIEQAKKKEEEEEKKRLAEEQKLKQVKKVPETKPLKAEDLLEEENPEEEEEDKVEEEEEEETDDSQFESISKGLVRLGVFTDEGELPKTADEFAERFQAEKQKGASDWINNFLSVEHGEEGIDLFKAIFVDKVDPREYLSVHNEILNLEDLNIDEELNQKRVFREFYKNLGWDETKIEAKLQKSIDYGDLESDSKEFYETLLEDTKAKKAQIQENKKQKDEQQLQEDTTYRNSITKVLDDKLKTRDFDGIPLNPEKVKKAIDFLTTKKYQTPDKQKLTEFDKYMLESRKPENITSRIKIALLALENFNFEGVKKRAISKETDEVFSELKTKTKSTKSSGKKETDWFANSL